MQLFAHRSAHVAASLPLVLVLAACSSAPAADSDSAASGITVRPADARADGDCRVVLRTASVALEGRLGPKTDCSSGTCWAIVTATFDVAMSDALAGSAPYIWYQGASGVWRSSAQAEPIFGAPVGFRRYQVALAYDTFTTGNSADVVNLIPYLVLSGSDDRLFDHNRLTDSGAAYSLTSANDWSVTDDVASCAGQAPAATLTASFAADWSQPTSGALAPNGKLDVAYDVYRMPSTLSCTTDGVNAFATVAYVRFEPGGQTHSEVVTGPRDPSTYKVTSLPAEFDVPSDATRASLWFYTSSDCNAPAWDSDYGKNYTFTTSR